MYVSELFVQRMYLFKLSNHQQVQLLQAKLRATKHEQDAHTLGIAKVPSNHMAYSLSISGRQVLQDDLAMGEEAGLCDMHGNWLNVFSNCELHLNDVESIAGIFLEDSFNSF